VSPEATGNDKCRGGIERCVKAYPSGGFGKGRYPGDERSRMFLRRSWAIWYHLRS